MRRRPLLTPFLALAALGCGKFGLDMVDATIDGHLDIEPAAGWQYGALYPAKQGAMANFELTPATEDAPVEIDAVWVEGDTGAFTVTDEPPLPRRIEPGHVLGVRVRFQPDAAGPYEGEFVVSTTNGEEVRRGLHGTGCRDRDDNGRCD